MAVNNTLSVKEYALTGGGTSTFPITFEFTTDDNSNAENIHCQLAEKNADGEYTTSTELTEGVAGDFQIDGGNVKFIDDASMAGKFLVIYRSTPVTQLTDFIDNGNYSLEDIERALDKLTFIMQERTGTPVGTYINVGVSLFFASILQLTNKADFLNNIFTWTDIDDGDKPGIAGLIRSDADLISKSGGTSLSKETVDGYKRFTHSPEIGNDPADSSAWNAAAQDGDAATRWSWVKSKIAAMFPVWTSNIANSAVTTAKIADSNVTTAKIADKNVTTAKLADSAVTSAKIADNSITLTDLRRSSASVSMTYDPDDHDYNGTWDNGGNKIPYAFSNGVRCQEIRGGSGNKLIYYLNSSSSSVTVYYIY